MQRLVCLLVALAFVFTVNAQRQKKVDDSEDPLRLPNGKLQADEILKADHIRNIADAKDLARLSVELRDEIEKGDAHVLSIATLKKTEEIEKLTKRIRSRIKRY